MLKKFAVAATATYATAIQLKEQDETSAQLLAQKSWGFEDYHWNDDTSFVDQRLASSAGKFTDDVFPANNDSLGSGGADRAQGRRGNIQRGVQWKRISEMFSSPYMFSDNLAPFSTVDQGALGDCYYIGTLAALDARPGAIRNLFYTKEVNDKGIYAMWIFYAGKQVLVHVDDLIPASQQTRFGRSGWFPTYANSLFDGEIWPIIAEKVWAKIGGSYAKIAAGAPSWVLSHLTNDPSFQFQQIPAWNKIKEWSDKDYLMIAGTKGHAWVPGHAYTIYRAMEVPLGGRTEQIVRLRNPWGWDQPVQYRGAYGPGTSEYRELDRWFKANDVEHHHDIEKEGGLFYARWGDISGQLGCIDMAFG